jgi:hypothetical protein
MRANGWATRAGNKLGTIHAHHRSAQLCSAHLRAAVTCGIVIVTWWWRWVCMAGVKGSPVQIRPSRRIFEHLYPKLGTKSAMIVPACLRRHEQSIHGGDYTVLMTALPRRRRFPGPAGRLGDLSTRQTRVGLDQRAIVEQLDQRRVGAGAQVPLRRRIHRPWSPDVEVTVDLTPSEHGALRTRRRGHLGADALGHPRRDVDHRVWSARGVCPRA